MFYPIPNAPLEGPDHMITSNEGELWVRRNRWHVPHDHLIKINMATFYR